MSKIFDLINELCPDGEQRGQTGRHLLDVRPFASERSILRSNASDGSKISLAKPSKNLKGLI